MTDAEQTKGVIQKAWEVVLPPINEIIKLGHDAGFMFPFILDAVALADKPENCHVFVLQIEHGIVDRPRSDQFVCGTAPTVGQRLIPPTPPVLIFLFSPDKIRFLQWKLDKTPTGQRQLLKFDNSEWIPVWIQPQLPPLR